MPRLKSRESVPTSQHGATLPVELLVKIASRHPRDILIMLAGCSWPELARRVGRSRRRLTEVIEDAQLKGALSIEWSTRIAQASEAQRETIDAIFGIVRSVDGQTASRKSSSKSGQAPIRSWPKKLRPKSRRSEQAT